MTDLQPALAEILETRRRVSVDRCALIAISGIDASGKGYLTARIAEQLQTTGARVANINIDGWLHLPAIRFSAIHPAETFYTRAIRFDEMFGELIFPLRDRRSLRMEMNFAAETAVEYRKQLCEFENIDIILVEGIYLLKRAFQSYYDLSLWVECSFTTALERALARGQEGLTTEATIEAYWTIYFPAQEIHIARDNPRRAAGVVINNDPRLSASS